MSIRWRILLVLILIVALTVSMSLALGYHAAQRQFTAFVDELSRREANSLAGRLSQAYTEATGWQTIDTALSESGYVYDDESEHREGDEGKYGEDKIELFHVDRIRVVIVDVEGRIVSDNFSESVTGRISPDLAGQRREIRNLQTGQTVGYAYVDVHQNFLETESLGFLHELLLSSILGGLLTVAIATLLAVSLSNRITAPITALTQAAEAIAQHDHASLLPVDSSDELGQMSVAFNKMTSSLRRQRHVRRRLINDISHELNTPLTVIHLEAKGLLDGLQTSAQAARHIIGEVNMLRNLTNDLNWLAETDSGELQLNLEQCAIDQLLTSEVERWQAQAEARQINLSPHPIPRLPALQLDPVRMRQAMGNIIHNALQHTEHGQVILTASMEDDEYVQISVKDDGAGISHADIPHVFDRFYRVDQSRSSGSGLGLDIARTIIETHGGRIAVHSEGIGCGTTVKVTLPLPAETNPAQGNR